MNNKEYFLGFDIGTGSVGWAVTDTDYNLIKLNRKHAWGTVLFDTSKGAEERRLKRCERRRRKREKERLNLLRELFEEEIQKVDSGFFLRLQESRYVYADKRNSEGGQPELPYALFVDPDYTDVDYHKEFPTIYHLRKALMVEDRTFDVRLVYLAISHILKNRGHFLANMSSKETSLSFSKIFHELLQAWNVIMLEDTENIFSLPDEKIQEIEICMKNDRLSKTQKKQEIIRIFDNPNKELKELAALITGGKVTLSKLFNRKEYDFLEETKICFDEASYEKNEESYAMNLEEHFEIIASAKVVYDWMVLSNILKGEDSGYLSVAKVADYEKHKADLRMLKEAILLDGMGTETERKSLYKRVFGIPKKGENNYSTYVGMVSVNGKKRVIEEKKCIKADFHEFVNKQVLPNLSDGERKTYIEQEIASEKFMPKARVKENSVIPYQLHAKELRKILENAEKYLPFLKVKDDSGKTVSEKIMMLLTFRIPYYVGPLNTTHEHAWVERLKGKVTPWNFEQKVDEEGSAQKFIERMTSKCTYLKNEKVLPMSSLIYEKYMVLNEINNLKLFSEPISVELKQRIYENLFERKSKVTVKKLIDYLKREEGYTNLTREDITGIDIEIKSSLKSYHVFKEKFTDVKLSVEEKEDIIRDITLFGAEPKMLKKRLVTKYPNYENQITSLIKSFKCNAWGRLSYKLLNGIAIEIPGQGCIGTVMYQLWNTNQNLMQIIGKSDSLYAKLIEEENGLEEKKGINYQMVHDLYVSPATKRQIWKAMQVTEEIMQAMGHPPKRIFVEMAREHMESKRSVTRKDKLMELYKSLKSEKELFEQLKGADNDALRSDKLYLYYTQLGRCAYTGKAIDIDELFNHNVYDIDHIYPQSKTADDSLDNRVLVCREENENKSDDLIRHEIQEKMRDTWRVWKTKGLISDEKYNRLIRTTELTYEELTGFVNRQLVETRQSTKAFMDVMKQILPDETEFVYSKAGNVSRFRQQYELLKVREINDLHHAKDAYLNIVVGNVYHLKFTKDVRKYFKTNGTNRTYNLTKMFEYDVTYADEVAWKAGGNGTLKKVKEVLRNDKVLVTRQVYERKGELFDVQPVKKGKGQIPLKSGDGNERLKDIDKYGGYNKATITYFSLIEGLDKKKKSVRYIVSVPLHLKQKIEADKEFAKSYFEQEYSLKHVKIIKNKILIQTLMIDEGFKMRLAGKSSSSLIVHNANQLYVEEKYQKLIKEISKFMRDRKEKPNASVNVKSDINDILLLGLYDEFKRKLDNSIYGERLKSFGKILESGRERFIKLPLEEQAIQMYEILKLFQCTPEMPDFTKIGGSKSGAIRISMNVTDKKNLAVIHQSVTGIYEQIERINV